MIIARSSSLIWLNCDPGCTRSSLRSTKRSTELCRNPTRFRPSNTNRRLTRPCRRQREMVLVETLNCLASSSTVITRSPAASAGTLAASDTSSTNSRRSWLASSPLSFKSGYDSGRKFVTR